MEESKKKILVVEDDQEINLLLCEVLEAAGYEVHRAFTGVEAIQSAAAESYAMILLDLMLPYRSGESVLSQIRQNSNVPVIILSAKDLIHTKVDLLRMGADDYIVKPFDIDEVLVRIETVLRRYSSHLEPADILSYQDIEMNCEAKRVCAGGSEVLLTATEYAILELFLSNPDKIFSKRNLFESITGEVYYNNDNTINVHISNLRQKLQENGNGRKYIETVYGMGYRLVKD